MCIQLSNLPRRQQEALDTSLHTAISRKNLTETARLIEAKANVNSREDLLGWTPLQAAIAKGWTEGRRLLMKHGADLPIPEDTLRTAIREDDRDLTHYLIERGAVLDTEMSTTAVEKNNLELVRHLIDGGAPLEEKTRKKLTGLLLDQECTLESTSLFLDVRRPKLCTLEVYQGENFAPISKINRQFLSKPIFLLNIADYDIPGPNYGAITQYFTPTFHDIYDKIIKHFTLVRVIIDHPNKLVSTIDQVKAAIPNLPLLHWALNGHGNPVAIGFSKAWLTKEDTSIMQEIGKRIDVSGTISIWGCNNGDKEQNIAKVFSRHVFPTIVFASPEMVTRVTPNIRKLPSKIPVFFPFFRNDPGQQEFLNAYINGEEIANGYKLCSRL